MWRAIKKTRTINFIIAALAFCLMPIAVNVANRFPQGSTGMWLGIGLGAFAVIVMMVNVGSLFWRAHQETVNEVVYGNKKGQSG